MCCSIIKLILLVVLEEHALLALTFSLTKNLVEMCSPIEIKRGLLNLLRHVLWGYFHIYISTMNTLRVKLYLKFSHINLLLLRATYETGPF